jgi:hypothetical protein
MIDCQANGSQRHEFYRRAQRISHRPAKQATDVMIDGPIAPRRSVTEFW